MKSKQVNFSKNSYNEIIRDKSPKMKFSNLNNYQKYNLSPYNINSNKNVSKHDIKYYENINSGDVNNEDILFNELFINSNDNKNIIMNKNNKSMHLLKDYKQKIKDLEEIIIKNEDTSKREKEIILEELERIGSSYKIYAESHKQLQIILERNNLVEFYKKCELTDNKYNEICIFYKSLLKDVMEFTTLATKENDFQSMKDLLSNFILRISNQERFIKNNSNSFLTEEYNQFLIFLDLISFNDSNNTNVKNNFVENNKYYNYDNYNNKSNAKNFERNTRNNKFDNSYGNEIQTNKPNNIYTIKNTKVKSNYDNSYLSNISSKSNMSNNTKFTNITNRSISKKSNKTNKSNKSKLSSNSKVSGLSNAYQSKYKVEDYDFYKAKYNTNTTSNYQNANLSSQYNNYNSK